MQQQTVSGKICVLDWQVALNYLALNYCHYLGRLRRFKANSLPSAHSLGKLAGLGAILGRWEKLYFNPFPSYEELDALRKLIQVDATRLSEMLPLKGVTMKPRPIRLCGACYGESPCHRIEWQFKDAYKCDRHQLRLLAKCTNCETPFPIPALWVQGECPHCFFAVCDDGETTEALLN